jgi:hypothetical protein
MFILNFFVFGFSVYNNYLKYTEKIELFVSRSEVQAQAEREKSQKD